MDVNQNKFWKAHQRLFTFPEHQDTVQDQFQSHHLSYKLFIVSCVFIHIDKIKCYQSDKLEEAQSFCDKNKLP